MPAQRPWRMPQKPPQLPSMHHTQRQQATPPKAEPKHKGKRGGSGGPGPTIGAYDPAACAQHQALPASACWFTIDSTAPPCAGVFP